MKIVSGLDGKHIVKETTAVMRYSEFMDREYISTCYLNLALCVYV
jgi:hypothetical protein